MIEREARWAAPLAATVVAGEAAVRVLRPRPRPPAPAPVDRAAYFSDEQVERARRFQRPQLALGLAGSAVDAALLAGLGVWAGRTAPRPVATTGRDVVAPGSGPARPVAAAAGTAAALALTRAAAGVPLRAVARRRAVAAGLASQPWSGWGGEVARTALVGAAEAAVGGAAITALARRSGSRWWAPAAAASVAGSALRSLLAPVVLDPLFNTFHPLGPGRARDDVEAFAAESGTRLRGVWVMDAGRQGALANAHAAGLGPTRRIVVFDTLLEHFDDDEVRLVLAHELSHVRHHDRLRGLAFRAATAPLALLAAQRLLERFAPRTPVPDHPAALPAAALAMAAADALLLPARRRLFRLVEERADHDSLELSQAPRTLVEFERRIVLHNRSELDPPRWRTVLFETHPPTLRRIGAALAYEARTADAATGAAARVSPPAPAAPRSTGT